MTARTTVVIVCDGFECKATSDDYPELKGFVASAGRRLTEELLRRKWTAEVPQKGIPRKGVGRPTEAHYCPTCSVRTEKFYTVVCKVARTDGVLRTGATVWFVDADPLSEKLIWFGRTLAGPNAAHPMNPRHCTDVRAYRVPDVLRGQVWEGDKYAATERAKRIAASAEHWMKAASAGA